MKILILLIVLILACVPANATCVEGKPLNNQKNIIYTGGNHWLTLVDSTLLEFAGDKLVSSLPDLTDLKLGCGRNGQVIGWFDKKIMLWQNGVFHDLPLAFVGDANFSDGKVVYSTIYDSGYTLYLNDRGKSKKITHQKNFGGQWYQGVYFWADINKQKNLIFNNGKLVRRKPFVSASLPFVTCPSGRNGLSTRDGEYFVDSDHGVKTAKPNSAIWGIDYPDDCSEYIFLKHDFDAKTGDLWVFKPEINTTFKPITTSCSAIDQFVMNPDGSMYYRCADAFYFKSRIDHPDRLIGKFSPIPGGIDRWLATEKDGALFVTMSARKTNKACVARTTPEKLINLGCF